METQTDQNQIVINTDTENERRILPNMVFTLAAGVITGVGIIFALFWLIEKITGI
jgi:capsular polysaccharide biosynthesis protein